MGARVVVLVSLEKIKDATNATGIRHLLHVWRVAVRVVQPALEESQPVRWPTLQNCQNLVGSNLLSVEYLKYIDIILTYCHFVEICRHGDVGLQK